MWRPLQLQLQVSPITIDSWNDPLESSLPTLSVYMSIFLCFSSNLSCRRTHPASDIIHPSSCRSSSSCLTLTASLHYVFLNAIVSFDVSKYCNFHLFTVFRSQFGLKWSLFRMAPFRTLSVHGIFNIFL